MLAIRNSTITGSGGYGIYAGGTVAELSDTRVVYSANSGIYLANSGNARLEANEVYGNQGYGIYLSNSAAMAAVVGNTDLTLERGNRVYDNASDGIRAVGNVVVAGNVVSGHTGYGKSGIRVENAAEAIRNVVHGNYAGISLTHWSVATENRIYNNSQYGIS